MTSEASKMLRGSINHNLLHALSVSHTSVFESITLTCQTSANCGRIFMFFDMFVRNENSASVKNIVSARHLSVTFILDSAVYESLTAGHQQ